MKTLEQFLSDYLGKSKGYPDGKYVGECLSICKIYIKECFGIEPPASGTGSAYGYWSKFPNPLSEKFEKVEDTPDLIPQKGWIGIMKPWKENPYGHIFIVTDGSTKTICKNWAQNWSSKTFQLESNKYTNIVGYLKPKNVIISDMISEEQKRILDFLNGKTEGDVREMAGALQDIPNLNKEISDLKTSQKDLIERIEQLEADAKANNTLIESYQSTILTAKDTESNLKADIQTWKNRYESKCKETVDKYSAFELIKLGLQKLFIKK